MRNLSLVLLIPFLLVACNGQSNTRNIIITTTNSSPTPTKDNLPQVVVTTSVLCDLTKQIAIDTINLTCIIPANINPVRYQPKPEDTKAINQAKLILYNGYNLEPQTLKLIKSSKNTVSKIAVGERIATQVIRQGNQKSSNPYLWHDAKNTAIMVDIISGSLKKIAPKNANLYTKKSQKLKNEITQLDKWIKSRIASIPKSQRRLITSHQELAYYTKAYGLSYQVVALNTSPQKSLLPTSTALINNLRQTKARTIFAENNINPTLAATFQKQADVRISERPIFADNLGLPGSESDTYQKMMVANTRTIVEGLGGTYLIFQPIAKK
jgi:manganese/iron transport system substrate-binding protein